jgi:hypothetical protein
VPPLSKRRETEPRYCHNSRLYRVYRVQGLSQLPKGCFVERLVLDSMGYFFFFFLKILTLLLAPIRAMSEAPSSSCIRHRSILPLSVLPGRAHSSAAPIALPPPAYPSQSRFRKIMIRLFPFPHHHPLHRLINSSSPFTPTYPSPVFILLFPIFLSGSS